MTFLSEATKEDRLFDLTNAFAKRFSSRVVRTVDGFELRDARDDRVIHEFDDLNFFVRLNRIEIVMAQDPNTW
jgi:hypothetical protein